MNDNVRHKEYNLTYFDEFGDIQQATFKPREYHNLMELLFDKYLEEWGDCKGRAWCGTCHIQILEGNITEGITTDERNTLSKIASHNHKSRLACQIELTSELDKVVFKIF